MGSTRTGEVIISEPVAKHLYRSKQERRRIVEETLQPGASVAVIARSHGVNANQVFHWRKLYREGRLELEPTASPLLPVRVTETLSIDQSPAKLYAGSIVVELGRARIHVEGLVDAESLRVILERVVR